VLRKFSKRLAYSYLPAHILDRLKKYYYVRALKALDENDVTIVRGLVNQGDYGVDVGANVGWYTVVLSRLVGPRGKVYSIEPIPTTFETLSHCIKKLKLRNVQASCLAISNRSALATMEIPADKSGIQNFYRAKIASVGEANTARGRLRVKTVSPDSIFTDSAKAIAFIKCEVEGHEVQVVDGANTLTEQARPAWLIEINGNPDDPGSNVSRIFQYFYGLGYEAYWYDHNVLWRRKTGDNSINYFFLMQMHLRQLEQRSVTIR